MIATDAYNQYVSATGAVFDSKVGLLRITSAQFANLKSLFFITGGVCLLLHPIYIDSHPMCVFRTATSLLLTLKSGLVRSTPYWAAVPAVSISSLGILEELLVRASISSMALASLSATTPYTTQAADVLDLPLLH